MQPLLLALVVWLAAGVGSASAGVQDAAKDPDRLYADRERLESALDAAAVWDARLKKDPKDFEAAWKLARACYWLGGHVAARSAALAVRARDRGRAPGHGPCSADRPEGHFWMAANMGAMAESFGLRAGIKYRGPVKKALETVIMIDRGFQQGSADRALGRWYLKVPRLFGGSKDKSVEHLKQSLTYDPTSLASHLFPRRDLPRDGSEETRRARKRRKSSTAPIHPELGARGSRVQAESQDPPRTPALAV